MNIDKKNLANNANKNEDKKGMMQESKKEKTRFLPKKYPRPWEMELTDDQRENLRQSIEADEEKYKKMSKSLSEDRMSIDLLNEK